MEKDAALSLLHTVDAYDFEHIIADLWEQQGWTTQVTQSSKDKGVDVIAERSIPYAQKVVIQAKRYEPTASVSSSEVQQYASLRQQLDKVDVVLIVTTASFSTQAENVADELNVKLIDGTQLYELFRSLETFEILYEYTDGNESNSTESVESTTVDSEIGTGVSEPEIPLRSDLDDLQGMLRDELKRVDDLANEAQDAFEAKEFRTAVNRYTKARKELFELQSDINRYEAGFDRVDQSAVSHLTPPNEFQSAVSVRNELFNDQIAESEEPAEQQDELKRLADEIEIDTTEAQRHLFNGDQAHKQGEYDTANWRYTMAKAAVSDVEEALNTYLELADEHEWAMSEGWQTPPTDVSVNHLRERVETRLDQDTDRVFDRNFSTEATNESVTNPPIDQASENTSSESVGWEESPSENARRDTNHTPQDSPREIVEQTDAVFSENILTQTKERLIDQRLVDYLVPGEHLEYVFWHPNKGLRTINPDESEETPHHDATTGSRFLLVTDRALVYVAGLDDHDEFQTFEYENMTNIESTNPFLSCLLTFTMADGVKYRFTEVGQHRDDSDDAARYIKRRIDAEE